MKKYILSLFLILAGCRILPTEVTEREGDVQFSFSLENSVVALGDTVWVKFSVTNLSDKAVTFEFSELQQFGFRISRRGNVVCSMPWIFTPTLSWLTLEPGASHIYHYSWNQKTIYGLQVLPGVYEVVGYLLNNNSPELATTLLIVKSL